MKESREYEVRGRILRFPVHLRRGAHGSVGFHVPVSLTRRIVPSELEPVDVAYGNTRVELFFLDHIDSDLLNYHHAGVVVWCRPTGMSEHQPGHYFSLEVVDQEFSWEAGRVMWGYPKVLGKVSIQYQASNVTGRLDLEGRHVFTLTVPRFGEGSSEEDPWATYTLHRGVLLKTMFVRGSRGEGIDFDARSVELELGDHGMAQALRNMGLPKRPFFVRWAERMWGRWEEPEPVHREEQGRQRWPATSRRGG
jgi:hypothetical protein